MGKLQYGGNGFNLGTTYCAIDFSMDIKNKFFRTDAKIKIQCSCFPVKCFMVKSVKQNPVITKDGILFFKV